jgi:hypothetical protein
VPARHTLEERFLSLLGAVPPGEGTNGVAGVAPDAPR